MKLAIVALLVSGVTWATPVEMLNLDVTQDTINTTICVPYYTALVRPAVSYTNAIKFRLMDQNGIHQSMKGEYQLDHTIPLQLGGSPRHLENLNLMPHTGQWNVRMKDKMATKLKKMVCRGEISLADAQEHMYPNWIASYLYFYPK